MSARPACPSRPAPLPNTCGRALAATRRKRRRWEQKILTLLEEPGTALTTRQMAERLDCYPGSLTHAVLALRQADRIVEAGKGVDPATGRKASCWANAASAEAAARRA